MAERVALQRTATLMTNLRASEHAPRQQGERGCMVQHGRGASPRGGRTGAVLAQVIREDEAEQRRLRLPGPAKLVEEYIYIARSGGARGALKLDHSGI